MSSLRAVFAGRNILLVLAILLGLFASRWAPLFKPAIVPVLGVIMTLACLGVEERVFSPARSLALSSLVGFLMNYLILSGIILLLAELFIKDREIYTGFVVIAAVPPAVAVAPFTQMLGGDTVFSLRAAVGAYLGGLIAAPVIALGFLDVALIPPGKIAEIVLLLIILPVVLSRILIKTGAAGSVEPVRGLLTNLGFFVVVYTVVGLNRDIIFGRPDALGPVVLVAFLTTFVLGSLIGRLARALGLKSGLGVSLTLVGTMKNYGLSAAIALTLFSEHTALPATVSIVFMILYFVWLSMVGPERVRETRVP